VADVGLSYNELGANMFNFWPSFVAEQLAHTVNERHLYVSFKELLTFDLTLSRRIANTGLSTVLCDVLSYCFSTEDTEITHPDFADAASSFCRSDCSVYCKTTYNNGVAIKNYYLHHIPSWLRKGQFVAVKGFVSVFYLTNAVTECPLCSVACPNSYFAHLLSPCPMLDCIFVNDIGRAFH
jgi:hypothetical protein